MLSGELCVKVFRCARLFCLAEGVVDRKAFFLPRLGVDNQFGGAFQLGQRVQRHERFVRGRTPNDYRRVHKAPSPTATVYPPWWAASIEARYMNPSSTSGGAGP